jgi:hypothetical protein
MPASSFHLWWHNPGVRYRQVSVTLTVLDEPSGTDLYFWAMQTDFTDASGDLLSGAHTGLQWINSHPGSNAVNWGGYRTLDDSELLGSTSALPSTPGNVNTRDYAWTQGVSYRFSVFRATNQPGQPVGTYRWRATVTNLSTGVTTTIRDLYAYGDRIHGVACWSEVFADCADPSTSVRWSDFEAVEHNTPVLADIDTFYIDYPGACTNTHTYPDTTGGMLQVTNTVRGNSPGDFPVLDFSGGSGGGGGVGGPIPVRVRLRNEGNTATTAELDGAFDVSFQIERNDVGNGTFKLPNRDPERTLVSKGDVVRFALAGTGEFIARIIDDRIVDVSAGEEDAEATEFICAGILSDWEEAVVQASDVAQCDLVPSLDERIWNWASGEYNPLVEFSADPTSDWPVATAYAGQGWGTAFYEGLPAGWTDSAAFFVWAEGGRLAAPDDDLALNALPGRVLFKDIFLVGAGKKMLEWACDDNGSLWVNGKKVQTVPEAIDKRHVYEFETTAGFLTLAWDITNNGDPESPPPGNPGALIASLRDTGPEGDVLWRTSANGPGPNNAISTEPQWPSRMRCLEYPAFEPPSTAGAIIRLAAEQNAIIDDDWVLDFGEVNDSNDVPWTVIDDISFRLYDDSLLDVLKVLAETWIDFRVLPGDGKILKAYNKDTLGTPVTVPLVSGYSTLGQSNPELVNVLDLSWSIQRAKFDKLAVRWADGWIELGSGRRWGVARMEQINDRNLAITIGNRLLALYGVDQATAAFKYLPLDVATDLPLSQTFDVHDIWGIPGPLNPDFTTEQVVQSISVVADENGDAEFTIEVGPQVLDEITWLERAMRRSGPGNLLGRAKAASASSGKAPYNHEARLRSSSPSVGSPAHVIASAPAATVISSTAPNLFVGYVVTLRLEAQGGTGTSTVVVNIDGGASSYLLSGSGEGRIAVADVGEAWSTRTQIEVDIQTVGHRDLHVYADVADVP